MLRFREEHQVAGVARRLKAGVDAGRPPGEVFNDVQDHVIAAARSHVERLVVEAFVAQVRAQPEGPTREVLGALCDLHALVTIEADRGWFLEHGRLSAPRSKAITREVTALLRRRLRPVALELVEAFGIPPEVLGARDPSRRGWTFRGHPEMSTRPRNGSGSRGRTGVPGCSCRSHSRRPAPRARRRSPSAGPRPA